MGLKKKEAETFSVLFNNVSRQEITIVSHRCGTIFGEFRNFWFRAASLEWKCFTPRERKVTVDSNDGDDDDDDDDGRQRSLFLLVLPPRFRNRDRKCLGVEGVGFKKVRQRGSSTGGVVIN